MAQWTQLNSMKKSTNRVRLLLHYRAASDRIEQFFLSEQQTLYLMILLSTNKRSEDTCS